jgi:hypothetical protein
MQSNAICTKEPPTIDQDTGLVDGEHPHDRLPPRDLHVRADRLGKLDWIDADHSARLEQRLVALEPRPAESDGAHSIITHKGQFVLNFSLFTVAAAAATATATATGSNHTQQQPYVPTGFAERNASSTRGGIVTIAGGIATIAGGIVTIAGGIATIAGGMVTIAGGIVTTAGGIVTIAGGIGPKGLVAACACM